MVFVAETELLRLRFLKPGYRHCFAVVEGRSGWVLYNPLSHYTEVETYPGLEMADIVRYYRDAGHEVVETHMRTPARKPAPLGVFTCVEAVKRVLGIHAVSVVTPWRLRQCLKKIPKTENIP